MLLLSLFVSCDKMFIDDLQEQELICSLPADEESFSSPDVFFEWNNLNDAEFYNLIVVTPSFDQIEAIVYDTNISGSSFTGTFLPGNYQWYMVAANHYSNISSDTFSFNVDSAGSVINQLPHILSPNNIYLNKNNVSFKWSAVSTAEKYRFDIKNGEWDDDDILYSTIQTETMLELELSQGVYSWGVQSKYKNQYSGYSYKDLVIDTISPDNPILSEPENESIVNSDELKLIWGTDKNGLSPVFDSVYISTAETFKQNLIKNRSENSQLTPNLEEGAYYWKVVSFDYAGNQSSSSDIYSFTIQ